MLATPTAQHGPCPFAIFDTGGSSFEHCRHIASDSTASRLLVHHPTQSTEEGGAAIQSFHST